MDEHTLVAAEWDIARPANGLTNRGACTLVRGEEVQRGGVWFKRRARHCWFARESSQIRPLPV